MIDTWFEVVLCIILTMMVLCMLFVICVVQDLAVILHTKLSSQQTHDEADWWKNGEGDETTY